MKTYLSARKPMTTPEMVKVMMMMKTYLSARKPMTTPEMVKVMMKAGPASSWPGNRLIRDTTMEETMNSDTTSCTAYLVLCTLATVHPDTARLGNTAVMEVLSMTEDRDGSLTPSGS